MCLKFINSKSQNIFFRDTPFVVFLWSQNAVNDTQFQLLSLTAERKQVEDRVVRCINVLLDPDVNIAHIKQENYKLKWPVTNLNDEDKKQKMVELAEKLHEVMQGKGTGLGSIPELELELIPIPIPGIGIEKELNKRNWNW